MKLNKKLLVIGVLVVSVFVGQVYGVVFVEEVGKLGDFLIFIGVEKVGNGGDILVWDGGLSMVLVGYKNDGCYVDLFEGEELKFVIDQSNVDQYVDKLFVGQVVMIKCYDDYFMLVYEIYCIVIYLDEVEQQIIVNVIKVELIKNGNGFGNYIEVIFFLIL